MATAAHGPTLLPDNVLVEILVRLPARCIDRCRDVCRAWRPPAVAATVSPAYPIRYRHAEPVRFAFHPCRWNQDNLRERGQRPSNHPLRGVAAKVASAEALGSWDGVVCVQLKSEPPAPNGGAASDEPAPPVGRNRNLVAPITFRVLRVGDGNAGWLVHSPDESFQKLS